MSLLMTLTSTKQQQTTPPPNTTGTVLLDTFTEATPTGTLYPINGKVADTAVAGGNWYIPSIFNGIAPSGGFNWIHGGSFPTGVASFNVFTASDNTEKFNSISLPPRSFQENTTVSITLQARPPTIQWTTSGTQEQVVHAFTLSDSTGENGISWGLLIVNGESPTYFWLINEVVSGVPQIPSLTPATYGVDEFDVLDFSLFGGVAALTWNQGADFVDYTLTNPTVQFDTFSMLIDQSNAGSLFINPVYQSADEVEVTYNP